MDRNVKIALGCGGAGCLGLIVLLVAGVAVYYFMGASRSNTNRNYNINSSRNSRSESPNSNNANSETNSNGNESSSSNDNESSSSSSLSDDQRHRLFHAASVSGDADLIQRVGKKIGIVKSDNTPADNNVEFATEHVAWVFRNTDFVQSINTPAKARAYVNEHIND